MQDYVAKKLSSLSATTGKKKSHGDRRLPMRQVHLEGLAHSHGPVTWVTAAFLQEIDNEVFSRKKQNFVSRYVFAFGEST